jgi:hypothetical protein
VLVPEDRHASPPAPPRRLVDQRAIELYLKAWQTPVSTLWAPHNADDVSRLAELELMLEGGDRRSWIFSAITPLRTNLWLLPKPMRNAGIRIEGDVTHGQDDKPDDEVDDVLGGMDAEIEAALGGRRS